MEVSVVVCQPSRPRRPCHAENLSEVRKTATKNERTVRLFLSVCRGPMGRNIGLQRVLT